MRTEIRHAAEKLTVAQLVRMFLTSCGTRMTLNMKREVMTAANAQRYAMKTGANTKTLRRKPCIHLQSAILAWP
jgi:hypothetical protein